MKTPQPFQLPFPAQANEIGRFKRPRKTATALVDSLLDWPDAKMRIMLGEMKVDKQAARPVQRGTFKRNSVAASNKAEGRRAYNAKKERLIRKLYPR